LALYSKHKIKTSKRTEHGVSMERCRCDMNIAAGMREVDATIEANKEQDE